MPIATKNGSIIVKDGAVAENCDCCGWFCVECGGTFTYQPPGPFYKGQADCPVVDCNGNGSCLDLVLTGYLEGPVVPYSCEANGTPKAKIISAVLDNSGSIGSEFASYPTPPAWRPCPVDTARISNKTVDAELERIDDNNCRMRVSYSVTNGPGGGPYGVLYAQICYFFEQSPSSATP